MRPDIWFAPRIISDLSYYPRGREEREIVEKMIEDDIFVGAESVEGIPAIRSLIKPFGDSTNPWPHAMLSYDYLIGPLAEFMPGHEDSIVVFGFGSAVLRRPARPGGLEHMRIMKVIFEIYDTVRSIV
jgi:hypothetical protein